MSLKEVQITCAEVRVLVLTIMRITMMMTAVMITAVPTMIFYHRSRICKMSPTSKNDQPFGMKGFLHVIAEPCRSLGDPLCVSVSIM